MELIDTKQFENLADRPIEWLRAEYILRRGRNPSYSLRSFAKNLDLPASRLSEVLSGKRRLTAAMGLKISDRLLLVPELRDRLINGIKATRSPRKPPLKNSPSQEYKSLSDDVFIVIADWYHFAILSLMETKGFNRETRWIAQRLGISTIEVTDALERLARLGLTKEIAGKLTPSHHNITTTHDVPSAALKKGHKQQIELALAALLEIPLDKRDITSITMPVDPKKLPMAKDLIREFRRQMSQLLENGDCSEVYSLNIQLIPLSKGNPK
jgi:DNA-binding Lrp family transcriptional regulator